MAELFGALPTASGVSVNAHTDLRVPAVLQAVRLIAEAVGSLPCKLYRDADNSKEAAKDHAGNRLAHNRVNGWTSAGHLRILLTSDALLHGAGYAHVVRTGDGRPVEMHRLLPGSVQRRFADDGEPFYIITDAQNRQRRLAFSDVLYIPAFGDTSPVQLGKEAIGVAMLLERHAAQFFGSGARPAAVLSNEKPQGGEQGATTISNIRKSFRNWLAGGSSDPLILDAGWKLTLSRDNETCARPCRGRVRFNWKAQAPDPASSPRCVTAACAGLGLGSRGARNRQFLPPTRHIFPI